MILGIVTISVFKQEALRCKNGCFYYLYMRTPLLKKLNQICEFFGTLDIVLGMLFDIISRTL